MVNQKELSEISFTANKMTAKIISCVIEIIIHAIIGFFGMAMMLLAMNGYNDAAGNAAILAYIISQIIFVCISVSCIFLLTWIFQSKLQWSVNSSLAVSVLISLFIAVILTFVAIGIGIGFGDMVFRK